jgi:dihydropteroate synthase
MGVLNVTPDSFSDGAKYATPEAAAESAMAMVSAGAGWIDIGGESTRPGSQPVSPDEQVRRVAPVISIIRRHSSIILSIDTTNWQVAQIALNAGANMVNDTSAGRDDPAMLPGVAKAGASIILMHRLAAPSTMQVNPTYADVTADVSAFLLQRLAAASSAGIAPHRVMFDPGIGFGKTVDHNLQLLRDTDRLSALGPPLVIGASRKSFIGKILDQPDPLMRIWGDAAIISWAVANQAAVVRVHDVGEMAQVVRMTCALKGVLSNEC